MKQRNAAEIGNWYTPQDVLWTGIAPRQELTNITTPTPPNIIIIITECSYELRLCLCAQPIINFIIAALSQRMHL